MMDFCGWGRACDSYRTRTKVDCCGSLWSESHGGMVPVCSACAVTVGEERRRVRLTVELSEMGKQRARDMLASDSAAWL